MQNKSHVVSKLIAVLLLVIMLAGCATTQHSIEIANVPNVRELYTRNTGTTIWGPNIAGNMQDIDRSRFSEMVDIRVVDTNGIVFSRHNVPFNDVAFVETDTTHSTNMWVWIGLTGAIIAVLAIYQCVYECYVVNAYITPL